MQCTLDWLVAKSGRAVVPDKFVHAVLYAQPVCQHQVLPNCSSVQRVTGCKLKWVTLLFSLWLLINNAAFYSWYIEAQWSRHVPAASSDCEAVLSAADTPRRAPTARAANPPNANIDEVFDDMLNASHLLKLLKSSFWLVFQPGDPR